MGFATLLSLVRSHSPTLVENRLRVDLAHADVHQSELYENPQVDFTWGTVPVGPINPPTVFVTTDGYRLDHIVRHDICMPPTGAEGVSLP